MGRVGECGTHSFDTGAFRVFVDGWPIHERQSKNEERKQDGTLTLEIILVPRKTCSFYGKCDVYSDDLLDVGRTLFSNHGNPKVASLTNALKNDDTRLPLLYISELKLPMAYRSISSTVGPLILQEVLKRFKDEYSIAIYIPCSQAQYSLKDEKRMSREKICPEEQTDEQILEEQEIEERLRDLTNQDMRQFFRSGFRQVDDTEVVHQSDCLFVFFTRQDTHESILSEQQALELPIAIPPPPPRPKVGLPKEIFNILRKKCSNSRQFFNLRNYVLQIDHTNDLTQEDLMKHLQFEACLKNISSSTNHELPLVERMGHAIDELINSTFEAIEGVLSQCEKDEDRFRVILDSDAVHVCAAHENPALMVALLKSLPRLQQVNTSINELDLPGYSPLSLCTVVVGGLKRIPGPSRQLNIAFNHQDMHGFTPLMICANEISKKELCPKTAKSSREFLEFFINSGADKNVIHANTGLSALGYFRKGRESLRAFDATVGYRDPREEIYRYEASLIERVLEPDEGATDADDAFLFDSEIEEDDDEEEGDEDGEEWDY